MGKESTIEWTDATWNIAVGCEKVDEDCKFCYMYRDSLKGTRYNPREVRKTKTVFKLPLRLKDTKSAMWDGSLLVFVSSLTDWVLKQIDSFRDEMWEIMRERSDLIYQMLTKRPERLSECFPPDWGNGWNNVWIGASAGSQNAKQRIIDLYQQRFRVKTMFLSLEPLHGPMDITNKGIDNGYSLPTAYDLFGNGIEWTDPGDKYIGVDWVIIGGESGNDKGQYRYRECKIEWIEDLIKQCKESNVPVFVKQLGTHLAKEMGLKDRHGGDINEWPEHLRIRQFPKQIK